jgi:hypothetical protein
MDKEYFNNKRKSHYPGNTQFIDDRLDLDGELCKLNVCNINKKSSSLNANVNDLLLVYITSSKSYKLVELSKDHIPKNSCVFGLDDNCNLSLIKINQVIEYPKSTIYTITCKHGDVSVSEHHFLLTVDDNLNIKKISIKNIAKDLPILIPRQIKVIEDDSPLDFGDCGEILKENGIEYVKKARTKAFRYVKKDFDLGYLLGHYCAEGSMNVVTFSCGNDKKQMEKVAEVIH